MKMDAESLYHASLRFILFLEKVMVSRMVRNYILYELHSGATIYEAIGAYELEKRREIIAIVDKHEYQKLMRFMNEKTCATFANVQLTTT